jgi:hypothetical protein
MTEEFSPGDRVSGTKPGVGEGRVVSVERDEPGTQVIADNTTYTIKWDEGGKEVLVTAAELQRLPVPPATEGQGRAEIEGV